MKGVISLFLIVACCFYGTAQKAGMQGSSMNYGEECVYDVHFKWGLWSARAGEAVFTYNRDNMVADAASRYHMLFKTTKFLDGFFKMRDTLSTYYNKNNELIYSAKHSDEGSYYSIDLMKFEKEGSRTVIHSVRDVPPRRKIDTILIATDEVTDLLGVIYHMRGINRSSLNSGDIIPLTVAIGKDLVSVQFIYQNQSIVERGNIKYNTLYFKIDIFDEAFESMKTAAEVWIGNDNNFIPIKVRSKLKIGYAEIFYKSSSKLPHPLDCSIEIKK